MSRGGWIMLIGGVLLVVGIGLFVFGFASLGLNPVLTTLPPGDFENRTMDVREAGSLVVYLVQIQPFNTGDELTVVLQTPSGEARRTTITSADPFAPEPYVTTEQGVHRLVVQNTAAAQSVTFLLSANSVDLLTVTLLFIGAPLIGIAGFIVLVIGLVLWILDRRRRRRQPMEMPPPPS